MAALRDRLSTRQQQGIFHKQLGYQWEFQHPNLVRVTVPTLPYEAFDSKGENPLPWHLMKLFDSGELSTYWPITDNKHNPEPKQKSVLYAVYYQLEIDASLYDKNTPKYPLLMEFRKKYVKRTSAAKSAVLRHPLVSTPYAKEEMIDVRVDPNTRKAIPFPKWWRDHFGFPTSGERPKHDIPPRSPSTEVHTSEYRLTYSDVDENGHANYTTYARLCFNSFAEQVFAGRLNDTTRDYFANGLKKLQISFRSECLMGDTLMVESWVDGNSDDTLYFDMKNKGAICATLTLIFHRTSASKPMNKL